MTDAEKALFDGMISRMAERFESAMRESKRSATEVAAELAVLENESIVSMFGAKPPARPAAG